MVAGIPGDNDIVNIDYKNFQLSSNTIYDDQLLEVSNIGLGVGGDNTAPRRDTFGTYYSDGVKVAAYQTVMRDFVGSAGGGEFDNWGPSLPSEYIWFVTTHINKGERKKMLIFM